MQQKGGNFTSRWSLYCTESSNGGKGLANRGEQPQLQQPDHAAEKPWMEKGGAGHVPLRGGGGCRRAHRRHASGLRAWGSVPPASPNSVRLVVARGGEGRGVRISAGARAWASEVGLRVFFVGTAQPSFFFWEVQPSMLLAPLAPLRGPHAPATRNPRRRAVL